MDGGQRGGSALEIDETLSFATMIDIDDYQGDGSIKTITGPLYGSYFTGNAYLEGTISYARSRYS